MTTTGWEQIDCSESIEDFLQNTRGLHDGCITTLEFVGGRFVDASGSMHCGEGDRAKLTLKFDQQCLDGGVAKYALQFDGVLDLDFVHAADNDGIIYSCAIRLTDEAVQFICNPGFDRSTLTVRATAMRYRKLS